MYVCIASLVIKTHSTRNIICMLGRKMLVGQDECAAERTKEAISAQKAAGEKAQQGEKQR